MFMDQKARQQGECRSWLLARDPLPWGKKSRRAQRQTACPGCAGGRPDDSLIEPRESPRRALGTGDDGRSRSLNLAGLALLALPWLQACGSGKSSEKSGIVPIVVSPAPPAQYGLDDPGCTANEGLELTTTRIFAWEKGSVVARQVDLKDTEASAERLGNTAVSNTTYGDLFERTCDFSKPRAERCQLPDGREKSWTGKGGPVLHLCKDRHGYARQSVEGVALGSLYYLQRARARYEQLAKGAQAPKRVQLKVLAEFVDHYINFAQNGKPARLDQYITHNLAYFPGSQMIVVFPEDAKLAEDATGFFWESEFVLTHEYGHHIDYTRHGKVLSDLGLEWSPVQHSYIDREAEALGEGVLSQRSQIGGALSEAFADLLAYYSEGKNGESLVGLPDIGFDRDPANAYFAEAEGGDAKILTTERLKSLLQAEEAFEGDTGPHYGDVHVGGALLTHALHEVFGQVVDEATAEDQARGNDQKYQLTLAFMDAVVNELKAQKVQTGAELLNPVAAAIVAAVDGYLAKLPADSSVNKDRIKREVNATAQELLPALTTMPYSEFGPPTPGNHDARPRFEALGVLISDPINIAGFKR